MQMPFEEFEEVFNRYASTLPYGYTRDFCREWNKPKVENPNKNKKFLWIEVQIVRTRPASGYSETGETIRTETNINIDEKDVPELDLLIEELFPDISFMRYKNLNRRIQWVKETNHVNNYYGDSEDNEIKYVDAEHLYSIFCEIGLIERS